MSDEKVSDKQEVKNRIGDLSKRIFGFLREQNIDSGQHPEEAREALTAENQNEIIDLMIEYLSVNNSFGKVIQGFNDEKDANKMAAINRAIFMPLSVERVNGGLQLLPLVGLLSLDSRKRLSEIMLSKYEDAHSITEEKSLPKP